MSRLDIIKRRLRDVIRAAKGEPWDDLVRQPEVKRMNVKVETFASEKYIPPVFDEFVLPEAVIRSYRVGLAEDLGHCLLDAGVLVEEVREGPHELGLPGHYLRMCVRVVIQDESVR